jgi:hypothetical protein
MLVVSRKYDDPFELISLEDQSSSGFPFLDTFSLDLSVLLGQQTICVSNVPRAESVHR